MKEIVKLKWNNYKTDILTLKKANILTDIKYDDDYFHIMNNEWLLDKYISRYGVTNEETPCQTKPAIDSAIKAGYAINLIVQSMKDDTIVCFKHKSLGEATGLNAYTTNVVFDDIKDLYIRNSKEHILTLEQALDFIAGRAPIIVEIMNDAFVGKIESKISQILDNYSEKYNACGQIAVSSVNPFVLEWFYENSPWYTRILRSGAFKEYKSYANIKTKKLRKLKYLKLTRADFIAYVAKDLPTKYIKRKKVVGIIAYNVTSQEEYERVLPYSDNIVFANFTPEI